MQLKTLFISQAPTFAVYFDSVKMSGSCDVYFWRQSFILAADTIYCIGIGLMLSFPSVLNNAILSPNSTDIRASPDQVSWITASFGFSGMLGFLFIPLIMQCRGRKIVHILLNCLVGFGFILFYFAENVTVLFIARIIQGFSLTGVTLAVIILAEYIHPSRRGWFMSVKKLAICSGSLVCHSLYTYWTWRSVAALAALPSVISLIMILFWPESPLYLAMKGKFEECDKSHTWLFGNSKESRDQLAALIAAQTERRRKINKNVVQNLNRVFTKFGRRDFLFPVLIVCVLIVIIDSCGKYYMLVYLIQFVTEITGDKSVAYYCSVAVDITMLLGSMLSSFFISNFKRRTNMFVSGFITSFLQYIISIIVYLKSSNIFIIDSVWLAPGLIILSTFVSSAGAIPVCFTIISEIFPLEHKGLGACVCGIVFTLLYAISMKYIPVMLVNIGVHGTFAVFASCLLVSLIILMFTLMETKDKTLQDIEDKIKGVKRSKANLLPKANENNLV